MADNQVAQELRRVQGSKVRVDEPLARHTSIKIGGPADYFVDLENAVALSWMLRLLQEHRIPFFLLGNGSNVLVSDQGVRGAVLHLSGEFKKVEWGEEGGQVWVTAGAAYAVAQLVRETVRRGYSGLEFAEGIPGSVGGALVMNAGAYGAEIEKVVDRVEGMTREGRAVFFRREELAFSYRDAHLPAATIVTRVRLRLAKVATKGMQRQLRELVYKRKTSQPSGYPNSGSMFRNPPGDFAGRLIEAVGLKGRRMGKAEISMRHANFIINLGGARAEDVRGLMELAGSEVMKNFGVQLETEVKFLGVWSGGVPEV
ncbi:MAG: UDP-N-acetylmuramate dehydrogenase [Candidatus Binatia bacterium]|nr:UDP-N-acetylmuramate dehydrogenase [Candidatus Binatia bacterium]